MNTELIVSVSGIRDTTRDAAIEFAGAMDERGVRLSLLVAPRLKGGYRLTGDPATRSWLAGRREQGDAIVLHGYDQAATERRRAEFAALDVRSPCDETRMIWKELGIPESSIVMLPGENTEEEMQSLKKLVAERGWRRVGLVTSAWHLPRALNLAQRRGLQLTPLPADFRGTLPSFSMPNLAPQADALANSTLALNEIRRYFRDR